MKTPVLIASAFFSPALATAVATVAEVPAWMAPLLKEGVFALLLVLVLVWGRRDQVGLLRLINLQLVELNRTTLEQTHILSMDPADPKAAKALESHYQRNADALERLRTELQRVGRAGGNHR